MFLSLLALHDLSCYLMRRAVKAAAPTAAEGKFSVATVVLPVLPLQKFDNTV